MNEEKYIAAIEISSSKIIGTVGRFKNGVLDVIAVEQEKMEECVKYGIIQNIEETNNHICQILHKLERRPGVTPKEITGVYIGLSGRSIRNIPYEVTRNLPEDTEITTDIINSIKEEALRATIDSTLEILDAIPRSYFINKTETKTPVGTIGNSIKAQFDLIVCRPILKNNIIRVFNKNGINIRGFFITPVSMANMVLTSEEKRLGCMLVDYGAETTSVSIYRNGNLAYLATLPLGSRNITRDITSLNVLEGRAEELKTTSGNAIASENPSTLNYNGIKLSDISNIVVARSEEIVANIIEQINLAQLKDEQLPGGIIAAGGGFNLNGMIQLLEQQSNLKVRRASLPSTIILEDTKAPAFESLQVISILKAVTDNNDIEDCLKMPVTQDLPPVDDGYKHPEENKNPEGNDREEQINRNNTIIDKLKSKIQSMFSVKEDEGDTEFE